MTTQEELPADQQLRREISKATTSHSIQDENVHPHLTATKSLKHAPKRQIAIVVFVSLAQFIQMYPYGAGVAGGVSMANSYRLNSQKSTQVIPPSAQATVMAHAAWIAASYPLTQGTFVLMGGRLGAVWGHKKVLMTACLWWLIWTLVCGFAPSLVALCVFRGLSGIGGGIITPNAVALLGITFPPGKKRNIAMALFGAMAPVGAAGASLLASVLVQLTERKWVFFMPVMAGAVIFALALIALPWDSPVDATGSIDWLGAYLGVAGLVLFNFVWNQAPAVGWSEVYIYVLLIVSVLHFCGFALWESKFAKSPILPFDIWKAPSFGLMLLLVFLSFMSMGIFIWYFDILGLNIRGYSIIESGAHYQPLTVLGTFAAFLSGWLVPRLSAQYILAIGNAALIVCNVLLATTPAHQTYWAMMFPAIAVSAFTVDLIFAASQIIASGSVGKEHQGFAGSLIGTLLSYGLSTGIGFAATIEVHTNNGGADILRGYRSALYFAVGLGGLGLVGSLLFLRVPKATKEGWDEEKTNETVDGV